MASSTVVKVGTVSIGSVTSQKSVQVHSACDVTLPLPSVHIIVYSICWLANLNSLLLIGFPIGGFHMKSSKTWLGNL